MKLFITLTIGMVVSVYLSVFGVVLFGSVLMIELETPARALIGIIAVCGGIIFAAERHGAFLGKLIE